MLRRIGTTSATAVAAVVLWTGTAAAVPAHVATAYVTPADGSHLARGAPVDFSVRTQAGAQVAIVVATMSLTDPQGRLFSLGAFGSLAHASPGDPGLYRWTAPAGAPLRRRPGTFYWQARVLPPGGTVEYGPVHSLRVDVPASWETRGPIPPSIALRGHGRFLLSRVDVPPRLGPARFWRLAATSARRWGLQAAGWTNRHAGRADGVNVVGFGELPEGILGAEFELRARVFRRDAHGLHYLGRRVRERDVVLSFGLPWQASLDYPDDSHYDLESVILHELGHMAGNEHHRARCTNSPMVEALGRGEWWRTPQDWYEKRCGGGEAFGAARSTRAAPGALDVVRRAAPDVVVSR